MSEEEGKLKSAKVKEGSDATAKGKSKKPVTKSKEQPALVIDDDD